MSRRRWYQCSQQPTQHPRPIKRRTQHETSTFDMNKITEEAFYPKDVYAIYLRKSRADVEAEKLGEGETLARHEKILTELAARKS